MQSSSYLRAATIVAAFALPLSSIGYAIAQGEATGAATAAPGTAIQVPLSQVSNPKGRLANASVQDKDGNSVGAVRDVITDNNGNPTGVKVDVGGFLGVGTKVVLIGATHLRYEQDRNVLTTTLRKAQIEALPEIKT
jgi:hypothetical protein